MQKELSGEFRDSIAEEPVRSLFNVMILYDELAAGQRAMELFSYLVDEHGSQVEFRPQIWRFDLVADVDWRHFLDEEARRADLFIISITDETDLPLPVLDWLKLSLPAKRGSGAAVVALLGIDGQMDSPTSLRLQSLRQLAGESDLEFFAPVSHTKRWGEPPFVTSISSPPRALAGKETSLRQTRGENRLPLFQPFNKVAPNWHWGINE